MHESVSLLKEILAADAEALTLLEGIDLELAAATLADRERVRLADELEAATREIEEAGREAVEARFELENSGAEIDAVMNELNTARICGMLAVEAAQARCARPWDLIKLVGCDGVYFDAEGLLVGAAEWLKRVKADKPWMFEARRSAPPLYRAAAGVEADDGLNGVLAGAARKYDGQ